MSGFDVEICLLIRTILLEEVDCGIGLTVVDVEGLGEEFDLTEVDGREKDVEDLKEELLDRKEELDGRNEELLDRKEELVAPNLAA